jgi:hypothetical protein
MIITLDFLACIVVRQQNQDPTLYSFPNKIQARYKVSIIIL